MYFAAESSDQGIAALGLDPVAMLLQAGTFLIIYFVVKKYLLSTITKTLEDRRLTIEESLDNAKTIEEQKHLLEAEKDRVLKQARSEAEEIIAHGNQEAGRIVLKAEEKAQKQADKIIERAEKQIESSVTEAKKELEAEFAGLVVKASETILQEKLTDKKDQELTKRAIVEAKL